MHGWLQGFAQLGGVSSEDAQLLHRAAGTKTAFKCVWNVADLDADGKLNETEFVLYMHLLKSERKGAALPRELSMSQACLDLAELHHRAISYILCTIAWHALKVTCRTHDADKFQPAFCCRIRAPQQRQLHLNAQVMHLLNMSLEELIVSQEQQLRMKGTSIVNVAQQPGLSLPAAAAQPSDMILKLAATAKGSQEAAHCTPGAFNLRQPLEGGLAGTSVLSPPIPVASPSFWQPFGTGAEKGQLLNRSAKPVIPTAGQRPVSAPSPKSAWGASTAFNSAGPLPPMPCQDATAGGSPAQPEWRAFDDCLPNMGSTGTEVAAWQAFYGADGRSSDAWAPKRAPMHSVSVPVDGAGIVIGPLNRSTTAPQVSTQTALAGTQAWHMLC
jgi:hypothetical protein